MIGFPERCPHDHMSTYQRDGNLDFYDLIIEDLALDLERMREARDRALSEAVTYRWLYLEVVARLLTALNRSIETDRQIRQLLDIDHPRTPYDD